MIRLVKLELKSCWECPYLEEHDGYADHQYSCGKIHKWSPIVTGAPDDDETTRMVLNVWFEALCPLNSIEYL